MSRGPAEAIVGSGKTYELSRTEWPEWARASDQVQRIWVYCLRPEEQRPSIQTTGDVVARLLTERFDSKDSQRFNYNWYAIVQGVKGSFFQSPPRRDVDFGHHLSTPVSDLSLGSDRSGSAF